MGLELERDETRSDTPDSALAEDNRKGYELLDGGWVEEHAPLSPVDEDRKGFEYVHGEWVEKGMSTGAAVVSGNVIAAIHAHVRRLSLGRVMSDDAAYHLLPDQPRHHRKPDVSFLAAGRLPDDKLPGGGLRIPPDLAVEVVSPTDEAEKLEEKLDEYLRAGVRLVWAVYIPTRNVWAYRPDGTARLYRADADLPGDDVLPGFAVRVAELFEGV